MCMLKFEKLHISYRLCNKFCDGNEHSVLSKHHRIRSKLDGGLEEGFPTKSRQNLNHRASEEGRRLVLLKN